MLQNSQTEPLAQPGVLSGPPLKKITKRGPHHQQQECRRYACKNVGKRFDDLIGAIFMGRHQPWSEWRLYLMGLNGSNRQTAEEPNLNDSNSQAMAEARRGGMR